MNPFRRFNIWFDTLREPRRMLTFFGLVALWYAPLVTADYTQGALSTVLRVIGCIGLVLMVLTGIDRCNLLDPAKRDPAKRR